MCIVKDVAQFIKNGARVLRDSSRGEYKQESEIISQLKEELFIESDKMDDKSKLKQDRKNIERDVREAWDKLKLSNGKTTNSTKGNRCGWSRWRWTAGRKNIYCR